MVARTCEICGKEYSSGASYRVHKSRYHRNAVEEQTPKLDGLQQPLETPSNQTSEPEKQEPASTPDPKKAREVGRNRKGGSDDWLVVAGGGVVAVILLLLFGGRK